MFDDHNIGKSSWLWEAINAFEIFDKDYVVNKEMFSLVLINETLGENTPC